MDALRLSPGFSLQLGDRPVALELRGYQGALERAGVEPGTVVAFTARVDEPTLALTVALLDAKIPFLPLHPKAAATERDRLVALVGALVVDAKELDLSARARPEWLRAHAGQSTAALIATSGSSGEPKLCVLSRTAFIQSARASAKHLGFLQRDRWLLCLPFAHVGGLSILTRALVSGRAVVAHPGFEPEAVLGLIERQRVSLLSAVPAMLGPLLEADREGLLPRLRVLLVGGAACPSHLRLEALARKVPLRTSYGLTEACSQVATQRPGGDHDPSSLDSGSALPGVELRIVGGSIEVRGPMLSSGYWGDPPRPPDGFFTTGDLGELDESGRLFVRGRGDDVIVTGGENVHPESVERVLRAQPGVCDALVFGTPEPHFGEVVAALVVLRPGAELGSALDGATRELPSFALPRRVAVVPALPLNAMGKPDRRQARREAVNPWSPRRDPRGTRATLRGPGSA